MENNETNFLFWTFYLLSQQGLWLNNVDVIDTTNVIYLGFGARNKSGCAILDDMTALLTIP